MRVFFLMIAIVLLVAPHNFAQSEFAAPAFEAGMIAANQGRYEKALENFRSALEQSKFSANFSDALLAKINYNIGVCYYRLKRLNEAIEFLVVAVRISKNKYRPAARALGMTHFALGDWAAAEAAFRTAIQLQHGRDSESWFDLGVVYLHQKDLQRAADSFKRAIRYKSVDTAVAHNNLGVIAALADDWRQAQKEFQTALALSGGNLSEAKHNLEVCRAENSGKMLAGVEFISIHKNRFLEDAKNER